MNVLRHIVSPWRCEQDAGVWETKLFVDPHAVSDKDISEKEDEWKRESWRAVI